MYFPRFNKKTSNENKKAVIDSHVEKLNNTAKSDKIKNNLKDNITLIGDLFSDVDIFILREFQNINYSKLKYCIAYCDGVVDSENINGNIILPLSQSKINVSGSDSAERIINEVILIDQTKITDDINELIEAISYGDTVLFIENTDKAIILNTKGFTLRAITEPDTERVLSGPREGFNESLIQNLSLVRRKLRTNKLKMKFMTLGRETRTKTCICYLEGIVNKDVLNELYKRLEKIDIDGVLDTNYITELIKEPKWSLFRSTGSTERPDVIVAKLLEGRVAVFLDGTPVVITVPYLFIENFQNNEDYYLNFYYASISRLFRILGFILTIMIPAIYIMIVAYHHEMLPTKLMINITKERSSVPLPAALEALILLLVFDILKETGIRMPSNIGQALSIVGALVIGESAVAAKLVAAPMIIIVAMTGITSLLVSNLNESLIYLRFFLLFSASLLGIFGLMVGVSLIIVHIINLTSMGVSQLTITGSLKKENQQDIFVRTPWWNMIIRPKDLSSNKVRSKKI